MRSALFRIVLPYLLFAGLWILLSDSLLAVLVSDPVQRIHWSIYKGWTFVLVTSALLYLLLQLELLARRAAEDRASANERRYHESQQRLTMAVRGSRVGLWEWSIRTNALYFSPECKQQLGYEEDEVPERFEEWESRIHPDDHERAMAVVQAALAQRTPDYQLECRLRHKDGSYRWILSRGLLELGPDGQPDRMLGCHIDITDRKAGEQALTAAKELAESANRTKDRFLASLSHELRTPLTPVLALLSSLDGDSRVPPELARDVAMLHRNVTLETRLIDDLLDLTRISQGKIRLNLEPTDAHEVIRHAIDICRIDALAKQLPLTVNLAATRHCLRGDSIRLEQVFWNVLKNAVKFTPEGGSVTVRSFNDEAGHLCVEIADSGIGIAPETLPLLFQAFQQGAASHGQFGGLGLGLAISKSLIELHGGSISARSDGPGKGATFTITLTCDSNQIADPATIKPPPANSTQPLQILLVEDDASTASVLARLLSRLGHGVVIASSVQQALTLGTTRRFDLLISDIGLPDGTGHDVMRHLKDNAGLKGIALSGYGMEEDIRNSEEAGFRSHLIKPVDIQLLARTIRDVATTPPMTDDAGHNPTPVAP